VEVGYPDMSAQPVLGRKNLVNLAILVLVPLPGILASAWLFTYFAPGAIPPDPGWEGIQGRDTLSAFLLHHPISAIHLLFFVNVCVLFWLLALVQRSTWLIDPYWTLIPLFIAWFYWAHPLAGPAPGRSALTWALLLIWSVRLTHNYMRREQWRLGFREDWRFAKRRSQSRHFWWSQFLYIYVAQQFMLVGLTLPFFAIQFRDAPVGLWDWLLAALALVGIGIAHIADSSLDAFMRANEERVSRGEAKWPLLDRGIWRWSRHPNYFGEQLFWWAMAGFGVVLGMPWVVVGAALNSGVLAIVTVMTERRMVAAPERQELFREYQRRTSVWIPLPPRRRTPAVSPSAGRESARR
jgi:steroid 5-alpha reductase family enzyme